MALKRYRVVRFSDGYGVIDHGDPDDDGVYSQDGDPDDETTITTTVYHSKGGFTPEAKLRAQRKAEELNLGIGKD